MHSNIGQEPISPIRAAWRENGRIYRCADEDTRRYWRNVWKRNGGRKIKTLRQHRKGR